MNAENQSGSDDQLPRAFDYSREFKDYILASLKDREGRPEHDVWYQMAVRRVDFQRRHFLPSLTRYLSIEGKNVLEIGCGTGPTTVVMAESGANVIAMDIDARQVEAARLRVRDHGLSERASVRLVESSERLDFPAASFDLVVLNGVLEHVRPDLREPLMREAWRVLRTKGCLFIGDTPNRLWPIDDHTTGLWWLHYMPLPLAHGYAVLRKRILPKDDLAAMGGPGCLFSRIVRMVPQNESRVLNWIKPYSWLARHNAQGSPLPRRLFLAALAVFQFAVLRPLLHIPIDGLSPYLVICIEKIS